MNDSNKVYHALNTFCKLAREFGWEFVVGGSVAQG